MPAPKRAVFRLTRRMQHIILLGIIVLITASFLAFCLLFDNLQSELARTRQENLLASAQMRARYMTETADALRNSDPVLAALLLNSAWTENLTMLPEQEAVWKSLALQMQVHRGTDSFFVRTAIPMDGRGNWAPAGFWMDNQAISVERGQRTELYDLTTGGLLAAVPHTGVQFSPDASRYVFETQAITADETWTVEVTICDTQTNEMLAKRVFSGLESVFEISECFNAEGECCIGWGSALEERAYSQYGCFDTAGVWHVLEQLPEGDAQLGNWKYRRDAAFLNFHGWIGDQSCRSTLNDAELAQIKQWEKAISGTEECRVVTQATADNALVILSKEAFSSGSPLPASAANCAEGSGMRVQSYAYSRATGTFLGSFDGMLFPGRQENTLLLCQENQLQIITYHPENFEEDLLRAPAIYQISTDGTKALSCEEFRSVVADAGQGQQIQRSYRICLWNTSDMTAPLWETLCDSADYRADANLTLVATKESSSLVLRSEDNKKVFSAFYSSPMDAGVCLSEDNRFLVYPEEQSFVIWDIPGRKEAFRIRMEEAKGKPIGANGDLLIFREGSTYRFVDLRSGDVIRMESVQQITDAIMGESIAEYRGNPVFAENGLIFLADEYGRGLCRILDAADLHDIPFVKADGGFRETQCFAYRSGILVVQQGDDFSVQYRSESGSFEERCVITPTIKNLELTPGRCCISENRLILNNGTQTAIYNLSDGTLCCCFTENMNQGYGLVGEYLVDLRIPTSGSLRQFPIPTMEQAREAVISLLISNQGTRALRPDEQAQYDLLVQPGA